MRCREKIKEEIVEIGLTKYNGFGRPGSELLSHTLRCSTIVAMRFHGRVRDGIGCVTHAITTESSKTIISNTLSNACRSKQ